MLTPEEHRRAEELFEVLLELPLAEREAFIERECEGSPELTAEVRLLLTHYEFAPPGFLQSPATDQDHVHSLETIGPYELREALGEGGMGVVYRAEQNKPVARTVALKVLKLGMDSKEILARFEAERQALARLEHPNIARVYDAGTTPNGRPYFVMEYVPGQAITRYCDSRRLTLRQRIELFIELCRGVQYAHQQGIIHRDLKPMNILVAEVDGVALPKVIDFGVAKAVLQGLSDTPLLTQHGQLIGTPEYMSPEQAETAPVDTRTDVYSLGAILYELLAGVLPIDSVTLRQAGIEAMMRLIREQDPPRPSTRVSTHDGSVDAVARRRNVAPRFLARTLRGELDWITLKALEKNPDNRYATVAELAADLRHHLADEPVSASPVSTWYVLRKFSRRHRLGVGVALTMGAAVAVFAVTMAVQARRIARERDRANHQTVVSQQVKDFLVNLFEVSDPSEARGNSIAAREILDRGAERIHDLQDDAVRAELAGTLAAVYQNLGLYTQAKSLFVQSKELWMKTEGIDNPGTLMALSRLAGIHKELGELAEADSLYTVAIEGWQRLGLAEDRRALDTISRLASTYRSQGHYTQAESLYVRTWESLRKLDGDDNLDVLRVHSNLAFCYSIQDRFEEAAAIYEDVLHRLRRVAGDDHPETLGAMAHLGHEYGRQGRLDEAESLLIEARESRKRVLGTDHPDYMSSVEALANFYLGRGSLAQAEPLYREVLANRRHILGAEHPSTIVAMNNSAAILSELGRYHEAEILATETLELRLRIQGDEHPYTQQSRFMVAILVARRGAFEEALEHLQIAVEHGFAHPLLLDKDVLAILEPLQGRPGFEALLTTVRQRLDRD